MDEKISLEAISLYGDGYSEKILKGFFSSKDKISGPEILSLCSIQQINLFIARELFKSWKDETRKLKSSFFDYEHEDVKDALATFMSVLSQHISIDSVHFNPLLKKAVTQTLLVIFDPYDFFSIMVSGKNNKLEVAPFREEIKYLKINKAPLERLLQRLDEKNVQEIAGNEAFALLDQILEEVNFTPEDVDEYIEKFSAVLPLDPARFYVAKNAVPKTEVRIQELKPAPTPAPPPPKVNQPKQNVVQQQPAAPSTAKPSINEKLGNTPRPTIVDGLKKITKIKDNLTINQKFMFTKVLFHGDFELFSKAIDDLDRKDNMKGALAYLEDNYGDWDKESEEFHEFMELVEKRFN